MRQLHQPCWSQDGDKCNEVNERENKTRFGQSWNIVTDSEAFAKDTAKIAVNVRDAEQQFAGAKMRRVIGWQGKAKT